MVAYLLMVKWKSKRNILHKIIKLKIAQPSKIMGIVLTVPGVIISMLQEI